jgi:hypothetical protein
MSASITLSGNNPTGTLTFIMFDPIANRTFCSEVVPVNGNGLYSSPTACTVPGTGWVTWNVVYSGDSNNYGFTEFLAQVFEIEII